MTSLHTCTCTCVPASEYILEEQSGFSTEHRNTAPPFLTPGCLAPLFALGEPTSKLQLFYQ
uniref:Uncharacterized protein n=1 Tax=Setaria digitata TaxID=48799 RepID=A0A915PVS8_9BILA